MSDLSPTHARNMRLIGHTDQGGRPDGVQLMVHRGFGYVGHIFSKGFSVIDLRDPAHPQPVAFVPAPPNTWNLHLQSHDDLLLVIHNKDMFAQADMADEKAYYKGGVSHHADGALRRRFHAGRECGRRAVRPASVQSEIRKSCWPMSSVSPARTSRSPKRRRNEPFELPRSVRYARPPSQWMRQCMPET